MAALIMGHHMTNAWISHSNCSRQLSHAGYQFLQVARALFWATTFVKSFFMLRDVRVQRGWHKSDVTHLWPGRASFVLSHDVRMTWDHPGWTPQILKSDLRRSLPTPCTGEYDPGARGRPLGNVSVTWHHSKGPVTSRDTSSRFAWTKQDKLETGANLSLYLIKGKVPTMFATNIFSKIGKKWTDFSICQARLAPGSQRAAKIDCFEVVTIYLGRTSRRDVIPLKSGAELCPMFTSRFPMRMQQFDDCHSGWQAKHKAKQTCCSWKVRNAGQIVEGKALWKAF